MLILPQVAMPTSTLMRRPVAQDGDGSRDIRRDAQAEGGVILRADGDDPQGGACTGQGSGHGRNGAVTAAYHEHADPLREGILDHPGQVAARFDQVGFRYELPGLHLMDHIHHLYRRCSGCPRTGIEDQLGSHAAFIGEAWVLIRVSFIWVILWPGHFLA